MSIDLNARIVIDSIANAEKLSTSVNRAVNEGLSKVKFNLQVDKGTLTKQISSALGSTKDLGLDKLVNSINELAKAGGGAGKVLQGIFKGLPSEAQQAAQGLATIKKQVNEFFNAIATGNEQAAKKLGSRFEKLLGSGVGSLGDKNPVRQQLTKALSEGVEQQTRILRQEQDKQIKSAQEYYAKTAKMRQEDKEKAAQVAAEKAKAEREANIGSFRSRSAQIGSGIKDEIKEEQELQRIRKFNADERERRQKKVQDINSTYAANLRAEQDKKIKDAQEYYAETNKARQRAERQANIDSFRSRSARIGSTIQDQIKEEKELQQIRKVGADERERREKKLQDVNAAYAAKLQKATVSSQESRTNITARNIDKAQLQIHRIEQVLNESERLNKITGKAATPEQIALGNRHSTLSSFVAGGGGTNTKGILDPNLDRNLLASVRNTNKLNREIAATTISVESFGKAAALAFKRYGAFLLGSFAITKVAEALHTASDEAIKFEASITKIEQVLNVNYDKSKQAVDAIRKNAIEFGTSANDIAKGVFTFAQAGVKNLGDLAAVSKQLSQIPLSATFGGIDQTVEGLIAVFGQFNKGLKDTGDILDVVNQFAADFAVESQDIFEGIKRGGAAFSAAGGNFKDFVALFSVLREKTRESADSLGTFFKTGLAQLLDPKSQALLKQLGVTATDVLGQLSQLSNTLYGKDSRFSGRQRIQISAELVGNRQFNRLLNLLQGLQDNDIQERLNNALGGAHGSFERSIEKRVDDFGQSIQRIKSAFLDFALAISQDTTVKKFAQDIADLTIQFTHLLKILTPLVPLFAAVSLSKLLPNVGRFGRVVLRDSGLGGFGGISRESRAADTARIISLTDAGLSSEAAFRKIRREKLVSGFGSIAPFATYGIGQFLQSDFLNKNTPTDNIGAKDFGKALQEGSIGGLIASGLGFGPLGIIVTGVVAAFRSLTESINKARKDGFEKLISEAKTSSEKAKTAFSVVHQELNPSNSTALANAGSIFSAQFGRGIDFATGGSLSNQQVIDKAIEFRKLGINHTFDPNINAALSNPSLLELEDLKNQIKKGTSVGSSFIQSVTDKANTAITSGAPSSRAVRNQVVKSLSSDNPLLNETQIRELVTAVESVSKDIFKVSDALGIMTKDIEESSAGLRSASVDLKDAIDLGAEKFNKASSLLDSVITNLNEAPKAALPAKTTDVLRSFKFNGVADLEEQTRDFAKALGSFVRKNRLDLELQAKQATIAGDTSLGKGEGLFNNASDFFKGVTANSANPDQNLDEFAPLLDRLQILTKKTFTELVKDIANNTEGFLAFLRKELPGADLAKTLVEEAKKANDILNKRISIEKELYQALEETNQKIQETHNRIVELGEVSGNRAFTARTFLRTDTTNVLREQAEIARQRASQSNVLNLTPNFAQRFADAIAKRNQTANNLQSINQSTITGGNLNRDLQKQALEDSIEAQRKYNQLQDELNNRLTDLDRRLSNAAQATDVLREAFVQFRSGLESAGQSITNFTVKDLAQAFFAFKKFGKVGLEGLTDKEFGALNKLLSSVGNLDLGNGVTGSKLLGNINRELGISLVSALRSLISGRSPGTEAKEIRAQLADMEKQAAEAAAKEQDLRNQQVSLLQLQTQSLQSEAQFRESQLKKLDYIAKTIKDVIDLDDLKSSIKHVGESVDKDFSTYLKGLLEFKVPLPVDILAEKAKEAEEFKKSHEVQGRGASPPNQRIRINDPVHGPYEVPIPPYKEPKPKGRGLAGIAAYAIAAGALQTTPTSNLDSEINHKHELYRQQRLRDIYRQNGIKYPEYPHGPPSLPPDRPLNSAVKNLLINSGGFQGPPEYEPPVHKYLSPRQKHDLQVQGFQKVADSIKKAIDGINGFFNSPRKTKEVHEHTSTDKISGIRTTKNIDKSPHISDSPGKVVDKDVFKNLDELKNIANVLNSINDNVNAIKELVAKVGQAGQTAAKLEVSPIQVNVALSAPDIIKIAGPQIQTSIMREIGVKLAAIFGDEPQKQGKIKSAFGA